MIHVQEIISPQRRSRRRNDWWKTLRALRPCDELLQRSHSANGSASWSEDAPLVAEQHAPHLSCFSRCARSIPHLSVTDHWQRISVCSI